MRILFFVLLTLWSLPALAQGTYCTTSSSWAFSGSPDSAEVIAVGGVHSNGIVFSQGYCHDHGGGPITCYVDVSTNNGSSYANVWSATTSGSSGSQNLGGHVRVAFTDRTVTHVRIRATEYVAQTFHGTPTFRLSNDDDCDGDVNNADNCRTTYNPGQYNTDSVYDSVGDACDTCTDTDNDGSGNGGVNAGGEALQYSGCTNSSAPDNCPSVSNSGQYNTDSTYDSAGDACDTCTDSDNDGWGNGGTNAGGETLQNSGCTNTSALDNCPTVSNSGQYNTDSAHDSLGDACDTCTDIDNDTWGDGGTNAGGEARQVSGCSGSTTVADNCRTTANPTQRNTDSTYDSVGDACDTCTDSDNDGFGNGGTNADGHTLQLSTCGGSTSTPDNCTTIANASQINTDSTYDGLGDACDTCTDADNDGWGDGGTNAANEPRQISGCGLSTSVADNCRTAANPGQINTDSAHDGLGDACDTCTDSDNDGWGDGGLNGDGETRQLATCSQSDTVFDNCTTVANVGQLNTDSAYDGLGDACDPCTDSDDDDWGDGGTNGDGESLQFSGCANDSDFDNCTSIANSGQLNTDIAYDGLGDACDACTDSDDDGWGDGGTNDEGETLQLSACLQSDTEPDNCTTVANVGQLNTDSAYDGLGDACDPCTDSDDDTWGDGGTNDDSETLQFSGCANDSDFDNCTVLANADQADHDDDEIGDLCDTCTDFDEDGWGDPAYTILDCPNTGGLCTFDGDPDCAAYVDNCPDITNGGQEDLDGDELGDLCDTCSDFDDDGFGDPGYPDNTCPTDNCPSTVNSDQANGDDDGLGNACDTCTDADGDGLGDPDQPFNTCAPDNCPTDANAGQEDYDLDGLGDPCDPDDDDDGFTDTEEDTLGTGSQDPDFDDDTILDSDEVSDINDPEDSDEDGTEDVFDLDSDGDGIPDSEEAGDQDVWTPPVDSDEDGTPDFQDTDSDNDGVPDSEDNCRIMQNEDQSDVDENGVGDACDEDDDGDGVRDIDDNCTHIANTDQDDYDSNGTGDPCEVPTPYLAGGCGADTNGGAPSAMWALSLLVLLRRQRRQAA